MRANQTLILILLSIACSSSFAQICGPLVRSSFGTPNSFGFFGNYYAADIDSGRLVVLVVEDIWVNPDDVQMRLIDVSEPESPNQIAIINEPIGFSPLVEMRGDRVWLLKDRFASSPADIVEFDISDPLNVPPPRVIATGNFDDFAVDGDTLFLLKGVTVQMYDITAPNASPFIGSFDPSLAGAYSGSIRVSDGRLFHSDQGTDSRLVIWDVAQPDEPVVLSDTVFTGLQITLDRRAPVGADFVLPRISGVGTGILNVSNPANLLFESFVPIFGRSVLVGDQVIGVSSDGLAVYDMTDPSAPVLELDGVFIPTPKNGSIEMIAASDERIALVEDAGLFGSPTPPFLVSMDCDSIGNDVLVSVSTTVMPDDTTIFGVPLADADIEIVRPDGTDGPALVERGSPSVIVTFEGQHAVSSISAGFNSRLVVNGSLTTTDLELVDGAVLEHNPESITETDQ